MSHLKFCRDGILRKHFSIWDRGTRKHAGHFLPLLAYQQAEDEHAFLKSIHSTIKLEDGLTVKELMENLSPWADIMIGVACMDFPAFLEEARKPAQRDPELSHIEIEYRATISPVPAFDKSKRKGALCIGKPIKTGRLALEEGWSFNAVLEKRKRKDYGGSRTVSLSFTPLSDWAHLPVIIEKKAKLDDETPLSSSFDFMGSDKSLTCANHPCVEAIKMRSGSARHRVDIDAPTPNFFDTIVRGFLWDVGFDYSPAQRDEAGAQVLASVDEVKSRLDGEDAAPDLDREAEYDRCEELRRLDELNRLERIKAKAKELGL